MLCPPTCCTKKMSKIFMKVVGGLARKIEQCSSNALLKPLLTCLIIIIKKKLIGLHFRSAIFPTHFLWLSNRPVYLLSGLDAILYRQIKQRGSDFFDNQRRKEVTFVVF